MLLKHTLNFILKAYLSQVIRRGLIVYTVMIQNSYYSLVFENKYIKLFLKSIKNKQFNEFKNFVQTLPAFYITHQLAYHKS